MSLKSRAVLTAEYNAVVTCELRAVDQLKLCSDKGTKLPRPTGLCVMETTLWENTPHGWVPRKTAERSTSSAKVRSKVFQKECARAVVPADAPAWAPAWEVLRVRTRTAEEDEAQLNIAKFETQFYKDMSGDFDMDVIAFVEMPSEWTPRMDW